MGEAKNRKLVVVQLSGGNDYLNCVVPYTPTPNTLTTGQTSASSRKTSSP